MTQYKVEITTRDGYEVTADDSIVAGQGTVAYNAIKYHRDVEIVNEDGTEIELIMRECVCHVKVTKTVSPDEPVVDDNCNYEPCPQTTEPDQP